MICARTDACALIAAAPLPPRGYTPDGSAKQPIEVFRTSYVTGRLDAGLSLSF
jgi:hypothetical protein